MRFLGRALSLVLTAVFGAALQPTPAYGQLTLEYAVKANYLVRFAAFVVWPPQAFSDAEAPVVICVAGRDPFGNGLETAARDQSAHGRPLRIRRLGDPGAVAGCHILYVGRDGARAIEAAVGQPVLVVTDQGADRERGTVHFVVVQARVRFYIDPRPAARNGLEISSRLLNLAITARPG